MKHRKEVVDHFLEIGKSVFACQSSEENHRFNVGRDAIVQWLWLQSLEDGARLDAVEIQEIISSVHAFANGVALNSNYLNIKDLKEKIASLPDNMPVRYERINDSYFNQSWKTKKAVSGSYKASSADLEFYKNNPHEDIEVYEKDGQMHLKQYSHYVDAFTAFVTIDEKGDKVFVMTAHY